MLKQRVSGPADKRSSSSCQWVFYSLRAVILRRKKKTKQKLTQHRKSTKEALNWPIKRTPTPISDCKMWKSLKIFIFPCFCFVAPPQLLNVFRENLPALWICASGLPWVEIRSEINTPQPAKDAQMAHLTEKEGWRLKAEELEMLKGWFSALSWASATGPSLGSAQMHNRCT